MSTTCSGSPTKGPSWPFDGGTQLLYLTRQVPSSACAFDVAGVAF